MTTHAGRGSTKRNPDVPQTARLHYIHTDEHHHDDQTSRLMYIVDTL